MAHSPNRHNTGSHPIELQINSVWRYTKDGFSILRRLGCQGDVTALVITTTITTPRNTPCQYTGTYMP